ncbi:hypothetical protein DM02DRAFT_611919 [Periconia macrospinosa]|uniref:Probable double zinc ribbon domain-containing protein n=1 Tax=Periconia macrospinosa TaxID=97972 RepID=A0A2V1DZW0_9PLEO|nr:hypothetical protein DM02DRAFT_611919 [Periconia macrospinosa]
MERPGPRIQREPSRRFAIYGGLPSSSSSSSSLPPTDESVPQSPSLKPLPSTPTSSPRMPACQPPPTFYIKPSPSGSTCTDSGGEDDDVPEDERAKWHCCHCSRGQPIYIFNGEHIIGALTCDCPHKPCEECTVSGIVRPFEPMEEPAIVPVSAENNEIWFGIVCPCCGLSWRAKELRRHSKYLAKMPSFSMAQHHQKRLAGSSSEGGKLRRVRSSLALGGGNKRIFTPPEKGKQVEFAAVNFSGFECTCGRAIDDTALRFQVTGPPTQRSQVRSGKKARKSWFSTTPELKARGHGMAELTIGTVRHANPLHSSPVRPTRNLLQEPQAVAT